MTARKLNYSTARENGMEFIANRWVFAGDKGYRVQFTGTGDTPGDWSVYSYAGAHMRLVGEWGRDLTEEAAHELAASLAKLPVHPKPTEV